MKKIVAGRSAIRLQDTPKGKSAFGSINEDALGMTDHSIIVADGMGGGGKTVPRENLEGLLTKNISDDARYIATNMLSRSEDISVSNMVAWGLVDYISHFEPDSAESAQACVERVRSAVKELVPEDMNLANIGSTLQYVNDANATVTSVGDSLAFTVYKDLIQFHNLDGFDSVSMYYLKKETGFDPYNAHDWDRLKDHHMSNMVTNAVLLAGKADDYTVHHGQMDIDKSQKSVTFVMSDGVAPDFLNPIEVYHMAQQLFDGEVTEDRVDSLLQQIIQKAHDRTVEGWDITKQELSQWQATVQELKDKGDVVGVNKMWQNKPVYRKSDDATIVVMYREPSKKDLIDQLFDDSADITGQRDIHGESVDGYLGGIVQTPNGPKDTRDLDEETTDPNITPVTVEAVFNPEDEAFLGSPVGEDAIQDAARREYEHNMSAHVNTRFNRFATWYTGLFDKVEEAVDAKILRLGEIIHKYETMYTEWKQRDAVEPVPATEFLDDEARIEIDPRYAANDNPAEVQGDDVEISEEMYTGQAANNESYEPQKNTLDSMLDTISGMYETGKQNVSGAASRVSELYNDARSRANEWYVTKSIELGDRYEAWSADRAARSEEKAQQRAQDMQEKEMYRRQKMEADKVAYEKAAEQSRVRAEEIKRDRELNQHINTQRSRARSQYWTNQREVVSQRVGSIIDNVRPWHVIAGLALAGTIAAYSNQYEPQTCETAREAYRTNTKVSQIETLRDQMDTLCEKQNE